MLWKIICVISVVCFSHLDPIGNHKILWDAKNAQILRKTRQKKLSPRPRVNTFNFSRLFQGFSKKFQDIQDFFKPFPRHFQHCYRLSKTFPGLFRDFFKTFRDFFNTVKAFPRYVQDFSRTFSRIFRDFFKSFNLQDFHDLQDV